MGFPIELARRYMASKKRASISMGTFFAVLGVALGVAGLATAMSVTGGFRKEFRDKVLGVNAHVLVLKRSSYFGEYREMIGDLKKVPGVVGVAPFTIHPMMVTRGDRTATGVLLKGVDPEGMKQVLDLPKHMVAGGFQGLRLPGAKPPESRREPITRSTYPSDASDPALDGLDPEKDLFDQIENLLEDAQPKEDGEPADQAAVAGGVVKDAVKDSGTVKDSSAVKDSGAADVLALPSDAPVGVIEPEGGYQSELPDDDILPTELAVDPCSKNETVLPGIIIGQTLGENLRAKVGDCVQVTSPTIGFSFSNDSIRAPIAKQFRVIGLFYAGFDQYDSKLVYTDLYEAQSFADSGDSVTGLEMRVRDIDGAKDIAVEIGKRLGQGLHYTMDWEELNHGLFTALRIQQILMSAVLALIIIVAAFTVIATLIMVVLDKKKEIAVLKAMGATDASILRAFLYQGMFIGAVGGVVGLVLAMGVCHILIKHALPLDPKVYFISHLPVDVQPLDFALVGIFAVIVCLLATVWPAMHASRLRPAEAFRE